jgi:hypothetical protein
LSYKLTDYAAVVVMVFLFEVSFDELLNRVQNDRLI